MNQLEILQWFTQLQHPFLTEFARIFTFLGDEEFYFLILPLVYWCISKTTGFRLFYIFIFSMYVNSFMKIYFAVERPIGAEGVNNLFLDSAKVGSHYPFDSFPSGHAQGSMTLWGYLAYKSRSMAFIICSAILILLISISRLYSGLHWPTDIIIGICLGLGIIIAAIFMDKFISSLGVGFQWLLVIIAPFIMLLIFPEAEGFKFAGILLGAGIGYLLEGKLVNMKISSSLIRKVVAFAVGIAGMFAIQVGLKEVFPQEYIFDFIRYGLIGVWGLLLAPIVFVALRIYEKDDKQHFFKV
ncbi:phosphatase PAP2 family protein [Anaerobacillus isosaccharinicus]|uniref:Phosphatase PAP2 family protein n=1 Tax=Anaerobacillus isosaccharinicus TaxID=1532552 RepID=A0A1S2LHG7_9BACI|nr:phosphatase PAP2 family protein [Anaerobacillus isosaccharinicus]MBA5587754.1 phosphatase PAP2 family protein [Anaerobacillus isosaccharinicus]QOY34086.1 phosphatase PAP2 family protein [Anaerobacillus isosaccharinicus]